MNAERLSVALTFVLCCAAVTAQEEGRPGVLVAEHLRDVELRLPAPYWQHQTREELARQSQGGCGAPRVPSDVLLVASHKDALVRLYVSDDGRFLMRNRDDLESYVGGVVAGFRERLSKQNQVLSKGFEERDGMIVHKCVVEDPIRAGGGCMGQAGAPSRFRSVRYVVVNYFVRPAGQHATRFQMICMAPTSVWGKLKKEIDFVMDSFRYTGETAEEFFEPDAAPEDVPTPEQGAESMAGKSQFPTWLLVGGLILVIWLLLRRKKRKAES